MQTLVLGALFVEAWYQSVGSKWQPKSLRHLHSLRLGTFEGPEVCKDDGR